MNMDELLDKIDENPIRSLIIFWIVGALMSLVGMMIAILIIVGVLNGVGVI